MNTIIHTIEQLRWHQLMLKIIHLLTQWNCTLVKKLLIKILNLKLVIMWEFPSKNKFLQRDTYQIGLKKFLWLKNITKIVPWSYVISDLIGDESIGTFYEREPQNTNQ